MLIELAVFTLIPPFIIWVVMRNLMHNKRLAIVGVVAGIAGFSIAYMLVPETFIDFGLWTGVYIMGALVYFTISYWTMFVCLMTVTHDSHYLKHCRQHSIEDKLFGYREWLEDERRNPCHVNHIADNAALCAALWPFFGLNALLKYRWFDQEQKIKDLTGYPRPNLTNHS